MGTESDSTRPQSRPETQPGGGSAAAPDSGRVTDDLESTQLVDLDGDALDADADDPPTEAEAETDAAPFVILDDASDGVTMGDLLAAVRHDT